MWILPKNYQLSSHFAQDMVASKEDLTLPGLNIESSLLAKSKPTRLRTWQTRWKQGSFYPHLFGRILKPCQWSLFETKLASLHLAIPANLLAQQEKEKEKTTLDTCGLSSANTSNQLDLFSASLKTSKDTSVLDLEKSLATWKALVTSARGEYSVRVKLAHLTKEKESTSWPTATVFDVTGGSYPTELVNGQWRSKHSKDPNSPWYGAKLRDAVETAEKMWPTPDVAQAQKVSNRPNYGQLGLANHPKVHGKNVDRPKMCKDRNGLPGQIKSNTNGNSQEQFGKLNPNWVEHLMGIPTGWTELGSWETE
jgi:hypothetical protein